MGGLRKRIYQMFHPGPTQDTNQRILADVTAPPSFEIAYVETTKSDAKRLETTFLRKYENDHGELPPQNRNLPDFRDLGEAEA